MNADEVGKLLGLMALADNRKPPEDEAGQLAMVQFWLGMVGDLDYADAAQAVTEHYRESREWLMPVDVRRRVKALRRDRIARDPLPAPPAELADDPGRYREALAAGIRRTADGMNVRKAIGGPLPGEPPPAWREVRESMKPPEPPPTDPREIALEQVAESRAKRGEAEPGEREVAS